MKTCKVMLVGSLCFGATMYSATTKRAPSPCELTQECERKVHSQSEQNDSEPFWKNIGLYNKAHKKPKKQKEILGAMLDLLQQNTNILSSHKHTFVVRTKKYAHTVIEYCPLEIAALLADDSEIDAYERKLFEAVAYLDTDPQRRRRAICLGIKWKSPYIVRQMLDVRTDVTRAPRIMRVLFNQCKSLHNKYLEKRDAHNMLPETCRLTEDFVNANNKLKDAYISLRDKYNVLAITHFLLEKNADLTDVANNIDRPYFKDADCLECQSIADRARSQASLLYPDVTSHATDQQEQPGSTMYQQSSSSSSSSSFSSSSSVFISVSESSQTLVQRAPSPCGLTQERERKALSQSEKDISESRSFWKNVQSYNGATKDRETQKQCLATMQQLLNNNPNILSSYKSNCMVTTREKIYQLAQGYPLKIAMHLADDSDINDPEREFFENVARLDLDHERRQSSILKGIEWKSPYIVRQILYGETDVTREPLIMKTLVDACESVHKKYLEVRTAHNSLPETPSSDKDLVNAYKKKLDVYISLRDKYNLLAITHFLLEKNADLTDVANNIDRPHFKDEDCLECQLIANKVRSQTNLTLLPQPSAPHASLRSDETSLTVYPTSSSSSSSFSSSSCTPVPGSEVSILA
jgi:hypothetical protein